MSASFPAVPPPPWQVREGLWAIPVPMPVAAIGYSLAYALEAEGGVVLVDAGWNTEPALAALDDGLAAMGYGVVDVRGVLSTHAHPDHYGLAGRVRERSGAWLALHRADADLIEFWYGAAPADRFWLEADELLRLGLAGTEIDDIQEASLAGGSFGPVAVPDRVLEDGEELEVGGRRLVALWTPGHAPGHLVFHLPEERLLFSGDHVLPTFTPGLAYHPSLGGDPVGDFLASLDRLTALGVDLVLPGHEWPFEDYRGRLDELRAHHGGRLRDVVQAVGAGPSTAWEIAARVTWHRPWEERSWRGRRMALHETLAHLHALEARGEVASEAGDPVRWQSVTVEV